MAFYWYEKASNSWSRKGPVALFGNTNGIICRILKGAYASQIEKNLEPIQWKITSPQISSILNSSSSENAIVIDAKPNDPKKLSLYFIDSIYGVSGWEWTPFMLRLKEICTDGEKECINPECFSFKIDAEIIYTFLYLKGDFHEGKIRGSWTAPRPSSTNTPLLWPKTFEYFLEMRALADKGIS